MKPLKKIPKFKNESEERTFWETHDSTDYLDWSLAKTAVFPNLKHSTIQFKPMTESDIPLWLEWSNKTYIKNIWFIEGYESRDYIYAKIKGNGFDYPFIIHINNKPIGYIVCCDLYAYKTLSKSPKGLFVDEPPGVFSMDLFIGEEDYLNKSYGTQIVKLFAQKIFDEFQAKMIYIDPAVTNKRAIRCYEKAGFEFVKLANDGICDCYVMRLH
jgi:aminoglycoside 6'-N-acetyltransferase